MATGIIPIDKPAGLDQPGRGGPAAPGVPNPAHRPRRHPGPHGHRRSAHVRGQGHPGAWSFLRRAREGICRHLAPGACHRHPGQSPDRVLETRPAGRLLRRPLEAVLARLLDPGDCRCPPMYSALKVDGKKLYELARQGKAVERQPQAHYHL